MSLYGGKYVQIGEQGKGRSFCCAAAPTAEGPAARGDPASATEQLLYSRLHEMEASPQTQNRTCRAKNICQQCERSLVLLRFTDIKKHIDMYRKSQGRACTGRYSSSERIEITAVGSNGSVWLA